MIYFVEVVGLPFVKIGFAANCAATRLKDLQMGNPLELRIVDCVNGSQRDEKAAHHALRRHRVRGEWFEKSAAMNLLRSMRKVGLHAIPEFERWLNNESEIKRRRHAMKDKGVALAMRQLAADVVSSISPDKVKVITGISHRAWMKTMRGETMLTGTSLARSLSYAPRHFRRIVRFKIGMDLIPIIAEADAARGVGR